MTDPACIRHPLIESLGVNHGFGTRESAAPADALRPVQVHGAAVVRVEGEPQIGAGMLGEGDAIVCTRPGKAIAIVTADCVPILASCESGTAVAAIHAGWRGLAKGVVEAGIEALREASAPGESLRAVIGPHIGRCCYEVDAPVLDAMTRRFGAAAVARASIATTAGHARLSLAELASDALERAGIPNDSHAQLENACTACEIGRFYSYRREGKRAGRMVHFIATAH